MLAIRMNHPKKILLIWSLLQCTSIAATYKHPIIGILTVPTHKQWSGEPGTYSPKLGPNGDDYNCYIPAGYVKLIGEIRIIHESVTCYSCYI